MIINGWGYNFILYLAENVTSTVVRYSILPKAIRALLSKTVTEPAATELMTDLLSQ